MTQGDLAKGEFSVSYVSAIERGQIRPSLGALELLAARLHVQPANLLAAQAPDEFDSPVVAGPASGSGTEQARWGNSARLREALIMTRQRRIDEAVAILQEALGQTTTLHDQVVARHYLATAYLTRDEAAAALSALQEALPVAERVGDRELLERVRYELGLAFAQLKQPLQAIECHRACYDAIAQGSVRDPVFKLNVIASLGQEYSQVGEYARSIEALQEAAALSEDVLAPDRLAAVYATLSATYAAQGDASNAQRYALASIQSYEEVGSQRQAAQVYTRLGRAYVRAGKLDEATKQLHLARELVQRQDDPRSLADTACGFSELYTRQQSYADAEREARDALTAAERLRDPMPRAEALLARAAVQAARGKKEAETSIKQAIRLLEKAEAPRQLAAAYSQLAAYYEQRGEAENALESLKKAWQIASRPLAL
jgi:tetratricopeptide (TPR) repeat protein